MNADEYELVFEAFRRCRALEGDDRRQLLEELSETNEALRAHVEALLEASEDSGAGLQASPGAPRWIEGTANLGHVSDALNRVAGPDHPESVGPFRIVRLIGEGGMGRVYEAEQPNPKRKVALKLVAPRARSESLMQRFELETDVLARLQHPGIAQIFECGEHDGEYGAQPYFAMELVDGVDVRTWAERAELDVHAKLALVAEIADAIEHAHTKGVVHRDLKPDNVLVGENGRPKVLDFGIARVTDDSTLMRTAVTETGQLIGTLNYMAPEQLGGDSTRIDARADVYALGVILFELLSGRRPHEVSGLALTAAIQVIAEGEAPRLGRLVPGIPPDVETVAGKALEKDPERRYATAGALASDLRRILAHQPITARPPSAIYLARRFAQRHRGLVAGLAATFLAIAVGAAGVLEFARRESEARTIAEITALDSLQATYGTIRSNFDQNKDWEASTLLNRVPESSRSWEWRWLHTRAPLVLDGLDSQYGAFAGRYYIGLTDEREIKDRDVVIIDLADPERRSVLLPTNGRHRPSVSPSHTDCELVIVPVDTAGDEGGLAVHLVDVPAQRIVETLRVGDQGPAVSVTAGGTVLLLSRPSAGKSHLTRGPSRAQVLTRSARRDDLPWVELDLDHADYHCARITSNGRFVGAANRTGLEIFSAQTGEELASLTTRMPYLAFTRDSARVVCAAWDRLEVRTVPELELIATLPVDLGECHDLFWVSQNQVLAGGNNGHYEVDLASERVTRLSSDSGTNTTGRGNATGVSADGRLATVSTGRIARQVVVQELTDAANPGFREANHEGPVYRVAFSPSGDLFATSVRRSGHIRIWDGWTGEPLASFTRTTHAANRVLEVAPLVFGPDCRRLISAEPVGESDARFVTFDLLTGEIERGDVMRAADVTSRGPHFLEEFERTGAQPGRWGPRLHRAQGVRQVWTAPTGGGDAPGSIFLVDVKDGARSEIDYGKGYAIDVSPDGERLSIGGQGSVRIVDAKNGELLATCLTNGPKEAKFLALAWSPDSTRLAAGDSLGNAFLVETTHYRTVCDLPRHDDYVFDMAWSPDGTRLVSTSGDHSARVYDSLHPIPRRFRVEERNRQAEEELVRMEDLIERSGSIAAAVATLLSTAEADPDRAVAARRACLLHWTKRLGR